MNYLDEESQHPEFELSINGKLQGSAWKSSGTGKGWTKHLIEVVAVNGGDTIAVNSTVGTSQLDYVQLNDRSPSRFKNTDESAALDDPAALPGQINVAGSNPGYLKYNGGGPAFLCGPDNPEDFLFLKATRTQHATEVESLEKLGGNL